MASFLASGRVFRQILSSLALNKANGLTAGAIINGNKYETRRGAKKWYPDYEYFKQFEGVVAYPEWAKWNISSNGWSLLLLLYDNQLSN